MNLKYSPWKEKTLSLSLKINKFAAISLAFSISARGKRNYFAENVSDFDTTKSKRDQRNQTTTTTTTNVTAVLIPSSNPFNYRPVQVHMGTQQQMVDDNTSRWTEYLKIQVQILYCL